MIVDDQNFHWMRIFILVGVILIESFSVATAAQPFNPSPHAIDIPAWFKSSFLDFREDIAEAAKDLLK